MYNPKASEASLGVSQQLVFCVTLLLQDGLTYQPETFRVCSGHASPGLVKISDGSDDQDQVGVSHVPLLGHGDEIETPKFGMLGILAITDSIIRSSDLSKEARAWSVDHKYPF